MAVSLRPLHPSAAIEARYRKRLQKLIEEMARSMLLHLRAIWRETDPGLAVDESPAVALRRTLKRWGDAQIRKFDDMAVKIAKEFARSSRRDFDLRFRKLLKDSGFTVKFKPTAAMVEAYRLVSQENVNLIRSIPQKFLTDVHTSVYQSVMSGYDMGGLSKQIKRNYGVTWRRASLIARDQSAKAKATFEAARRVELGVTQAQWVHSGGGKEPRPEHVRWGRERKVFDVTKGLWSKVDQEWQLPSTAINCRCSSRSIIPGLQ
jgi:uncharacterized protein with gpF-like domain